MRNFNEVVVVGRFNGFFYKGGGKIQREVCTKYRTVSVRGLGGLFEYPTGEEGLTQLGYPDEVISFLPEDVKSYFCGVGNPIREAGFSGAKRILDVGSGGGVDAIIAAHIAGSESEVTGIDILPEMVDLAKQNAEKAGVKNISFIHTSADDLPFSDGHFDILLSNGVFNLIVDKDKTISSMSVKRTHVNLGKWMRMLRILNGLPENCDGPGVFLP